jgi:hypothetical protein
MPRCPGVYVISLGQRLTYVGSSWSLAERFPYHKIRCVEGVWITPWGGSVHLRIKYKRSKRFGDWLMDEARLIRKLVPPGNKTMISAARAPSVW